MKPKITQTAARWLGAVAGTTGMCSCVLLGAPMALADANDGCTGADFAEVTAGVASKMADYLFSHPDVNAVITGLEVAPRGESAVRLVDYESSHPDVRADIAGIRQPIVDFDARCGYGTQRDSNGQPILPRD